MARDPDEFVNRWTSSVQRQGFAAAWRQHVREIARRHTKDDAPDMLGDGLLALFDAVPDVKADVRDDVAAAPAADHRDFVTGNAMQLAAIGHPCPEILEGDGRPMACMHNASFTNWGQTVTNVPSLTVVPRTKVGVMNVVKWAAANGRRVRAAGYRHTWGDLYSDDGEVLVSLLPVDVAVDLPARHPPIDPHNELQGIEFVGEVVEGGITKKLCRIGAGTTNEQFRRWCLDPQGGDWGWTVPLNVIMVEITWGGSNAPICHGAGRSQRTLSDLVTAIEFVNARGELQAVDDPEQLAAASGCFGLLGIVVSITLKLEPMSYARMNPVKQRVALAVPPPDGFAVPTEIDMSGISDADLATARTEFVRRCEEEYYAEWFWFAFQPDCWINTWPNDGQRHEASDYPSLVDTYAQEAEEYLAQLITESKVFNWLPTSVQIDMVAGGAMELLPSGNEIVTPLIDALHFRRGIQNMRVLDLELEIPIPPRADDPTKPDWAVVQRAWWDLIDEVYHRDDKPMRLTMEMRIMGDSGVTMAPQYGNDFGTCAIEVLTTVNVDRAEWRAFMQTVTDRWTSYTGQDGQALNVRPHWAKQWQGLTMHGRPIEDHLREVAYVDRFPQFRSQLEAIAQAGGYSLDDMASRFTNSLTAKIFAPVFQ